MTKGTTPDEAELPPCPFDCDGEPYRHEADFEIVAAIAIGCSKCGCMGPFIDVENEEPTEDDWVKAEKGWNTRASSERTEKLEAALKRLSFAAQTSGGTAGRDAELVAAISQADAALSEKAGI